MIEDNNQAIVFTDINGKEYEISDKELRNKDIRFDLSIRIFREITIVDDEGNNQTIESDSPDDQVKIGENESAQVNKRLEYHVDMVNNYFEDIESTKIVTHDEFFRILSALGEQEKVKPDDNDQKDEPEKPKESDNVENKTEKPKTTTTKKATTKKSKK